MNVWQKVGVVFFGFQVVMLTLLTSLSALHGHPILQLLSLAAAAFGALKFITARSRTTLKTDAQAAATATSPVANPAPAQSATAAPPPAKTRVSTPVYCKSAVVQFKNQP